ncbi:MAG: DUF2029 domain-containing protein [Anaerolineae bacterium]|nr:DUF2029 domain-containing protein [Anaerolineae bacterium]
MNARYSPASTFQRMVHDYTSTDMKFRVLRFVLIVALLVGASLSLVLGIQSLASPYVYLKDFIQEYLLAKALLWRINPYLPIPELAEKLIETLSVPVFPHPTPHPPSVAFFFVPLALLDYETAARVWLVVEVVCIVIAAALLVRYLFSGWRLSRNLIMVGIMLIFPSFRESLMLGQLMTLALVLLLLAYLSLRRGLDMMVGLSIGGLLSIKLMGWPIVLYFALRGRWRVVLTAIGLFASLNLSASLFWGFDQVVDYFLSVGPLVSNLYKSYSLNFSTWAIGWRWFVGTGTGMQVFEGLAAPPLVYLPGLAQSLAVAFPLVCLLIGMKLALVMDDHERAFVFLACMSIIINPVSWGHYLVLLCLPAAFVFKRLAAAHYPTGQTLFALGIVLLHLVSPGQWCDIAMFVSGVQRLGTEVSFFAAQLTLIPLLLVMAWMYVVRRIQDITGRK